MPSDVPSRARWSTDCSWRRPGLVGGDAEGMEMIRKRIGSHIVKLIRSFDWLPYGLVSVYDHWWVAE